MPEQLWKEACTAAKRLGTGRVARALGLGYEGLKQRVLAGRAVGLRDEARGLPVEAQFIELTGFAAEGQAAARDEAVIEIVATDGARVIIRLKAASLDVAALVRVLRGRP
jgi:hypothetical protein